MFILGEKSPAKSSREADKPTGISAAKDSGPWFEKRQFNRGIRIALKMEMWLFLKPAAVKMEKTHPEGHIQVSFDGKWYSDFKQNRFCPYKDGHILPYKVYRPAKTYKR